VINITATTIVKFNEVSGFQTGLPVQYKGILGANGEVTGTSMEVN